MLSNNLFGPVQQWGYIVKDLDQAMESWVKQLGVGPFWGFRNVPLKSNYAGEQTEVIIDVGLAYQNGVQIELIHQTSETSSPYSWFYQTQDAQAFHQVAYYCLDIKAALQKAEGVGLVVLGYVESAMGARYYYLNSPAMQGLVVELMEVDQMLIDAFADCAKQAEQWDGKDPYRLVNV